MELEQFDKFLIKNQPNLFVSLRGGIQLLVKLKSSLKC